MVMPAAKRQAVAHACAVHGVSERRACRILGVDRTSMRYRSCRAGESEVRLRIRELACRRRRFGTISLKESSGGAREAGRSRC
jgi:putative transposase